MGSRPTISDLAAASGVSVATVDRVLNGRHPVREETTRRVYEAATSIGYHAAGLIRQRIHADLPLVKFGILLQKPETEFYKAFGAAIEKAIRESKSVRGVCVLDYVSDLAPNVVAAKLREMAPRVNAIAMVAVDHPNITAAVSELRDKGMPVFALLSEFATGIRTGYIGVDNRKVGRTAAWTIAKAAKGPGKVAVFVGSHRFLGHDMREIGFRTYFREHAPDFHVLDTLVNLDDRRFTHQNILELMARHKDLAGFYVAGGGMEGAVDALRETAEGRELVVVVNELTPMSRAALADQIITMTLSTPLVLLCERLVDLMVRAVSKEDVELPGQTFLPFEMHISENI
ncbi:MAG: LacI family DNA-binding transcriptional regulator [Rhizobiaceae bacterium]